MSRHTGGAGSAPRPKILFATIAAGGSHVSSAQAMREALETAYPGRFDLRIAEIMKDYGFADFDRRHKRAWRWALAHPWTVVWGQRLIDSVPGLSVAVHRRLLRDFAARAAEVLRHEAPSLIVANHGWLTTALALCRRRYGLTVPVLTFVTSTLDATALWADPDAERLVVGSEVARARLVELGVASSKIDVVGYPVRQAFLNAPPKREARRRLGLKDHFTCLISLGGEGVGGRPQEILAALRSLEPPVQVVVVAGRNERLRAELSRLAQDDPLLRVEGFVTNMADFVAAGDVVIGKTGPAAVFESLAVGRPVLAPYRSGGVENRFIAFLEHNGLGCYTPTMDRLRDAVTAFRAGPEPLMKVEARCRSLDFPGMARRLAAYIAHYAEAGEPNPALLGEGVPWSVPEALSVARSAPGDVRRRAAAGKPTSDGATETTLDPRP